MSKLVFIISFLTSLIIITIAIMRFAYLKETFELMYIGVGIPVLMYVIFIYLKMINKLQVEQTYVKVKNLIFGVKIIRFEEVQQWEEIDTSLRLNQRNLLLRVNGKKIVISSMVNQYNYEQLRTKLKTKCKEFEKIN